MTAVLDIVIPLLAGLSILVAIFFLLRGLRFRTRSARATYGVAQQEARQAMLVDFVRGAAAVFVGLILLSVAGLSPQPQDGEPVIAEPSPTLAPATTTPETDLPTPSSPSVTSEPTQATVTATRAATSVPTLTPSATTTLAPTPTETPSPEPEPATATVNSGVGVWLRSEPSLEGEQLEWVLDGTVLTLLPEVETADELEWQHVVTPEGNEGWVAVPFIVYNQ